MPFPGIPVLGSWDPEVHIDDLYWRRWCQWNGSKQGRSIVLEIPRDGRVGLATSLRFEHRMVSSRVAWPMAGVSEEAKGRHGCHELLPSVPFRRYDSHPPRDETPRWGGGPSIEQRRAAVNIRDFAAKLSQTNDRPDRPDRADLVAYRRLTAQGNLRNAQEELDGSWDIWSM